MKSTPAVFVLAAFATCVFAIERITAAESAAATATCTGCCDKACAGEHSCCQQAETTAATACPASDVKATVVSTTTSATSACCGEDCACSCEKSCCNQQAATAATGTKPAAIIGIPSTTTIIAKIFAATGAGECADCCSCKSECTTACAADLQRSGLDPYRIEPPDVLSIFVPMLAPECAEVREKLAAKGIAIDIELPFSNAECEQVVGPDGRIAIEGIGDVYVAGMTVEDARLAITKKIFESCPAASRAAFAVVVNVASINSKQAYIILEGGARGDYVRTLLVSKGMSVNCATNKSTWPNPIDFATAKLWITRPSQHGETVLPVAWDAVKGEPTEATNHAILPGDRLFVKLEDELTPPMPVAVAVPPTALPATPYCAPQAAGTLTLSSPISPVTPYAPSEPSATYYSAFPEAVPSPFAPQLSSPNLTTPLIATQAFISTTPLQAPPAPVAKSPQCAGETSACSSATCANCPTCAALHADSSTKVAQVRFDVEIIEDHTGSMKEFKTLESDMPILTAESEVILPTIRILEKQELVRRISSPRLITVVDQPAQIQIGSEVPSEGSTKPSFRGLMLKTAAREIGGGLNVDFQFKDTNGSSSLEVETSLLVAHGQTIVMKTTGRHRDPRENGEQKTAVRPTVYVVLTPELIK